MATLARHPKEFFDTFLIERNGSEATVLAAAGVTGGLLMSVLLALARSFNLTTLNYEMNLGSSFLPQTNSFAWLLGFVLHLSICVLIALLFGLVFRKIRATGPSIGAALGVGYWMIGGLLFGLFPSVGFFALSSGLFSFFFNFLLHVIFGAIVGGYHADYLDGRARK